MDVNKEIIEMAENRIWTLCEKAHSAIYHSFSRDKVMSTGNKKYNVNHNFDLTHLPNSFKPVT